MKNHINNNNNNYRIINNKINNRNIILLKNTLNQAKWNKKMILLN